MTAPFDYKMLKQVRDRALTQPKDAEDAMSCVKPQSPDCLIGYMT